MKFPSDEVWGPRYLHLAVAPLLVCLGAAWPGFEWRRDIFLVSLAVTGVAISFLGAFYYYGEWSRAMRDADQNTMEWIVGDNAWNPVTFDARVFRVWLEGGDTPVPWTNAHLWVWEPPPGAAPWKAINLRTYSQPQSFVLSHWNSVRDDSTRLLVWMYVFSLFVGVFSLFWTILSTAGERRASASRAHRVGADRV